jgi:hypothetical protein
MTLLGASPIEEFSEDGDRIQLKQTKGHGGLCIVRIYRGVLSVRICFVLAAD